MEANNIKRARRSWTRNVKVITLRPSPPSSPTFRQDGRHFSHQFLYYFINELIYQTGNHTFDRLRMRADCKGTAKRRGHRKSKTSTCECCSPSSSVCFADRYFRLTINRSWLLTSLPVHTTANILIIRRIRIPIWKWQWVWVLPAYNRAPSSLLTSFLNISDTPIIKNILGSYELN